MRLTPGNLSGGSHDEWVILMDDEDNYEDDGDDERGGKMVLSNKQAKNFFLEHLVSMRRSLVISDP